MDDVDGIARVTVRSWRETYAGVLADHHFDDGALDRRRDQWTRFLTMDPLPGRLVVATVQIRRSRAVRLRGSRCGCSHLRTTSAFGPARALRQRASRRAEEVTVVDGCRVTTPLRTAWDIARRERRADGVVAIDSLARNSGLALDALVDMAFRLRKRPGAALVRAATSRADPRAESPMETRMRLVLTDAGLPAPVSQYELVEAGRVVARFDLAYPDARLAIEYDGTAHDDVLDRRREVRTGALGWLTIRLVSADILQAPEETAASVREVLHRRLLLHERP
ncbi:MAG: hypothetical protein ABT15_23040 [Pseudonocardia sp. SCN 73-27]|nr:MAG: hypothetical protein ABS80_22760 [Pseudonocardia sp. SCN 72-51]ODV03273.1 MAG: hypothetical protein ABT15_23040 [Pseudonocardia sp. SCN 73-27]